MGTFLTHVTCIEQDLTGQFLLESQAPGLLVWDVLTNGAYRARRGIPDISEGSERVARRRYVAAGKRSDDLTGCVAQCVKRRCTIGKSRVPRRLNAKALEDPRACSRSATPL